jgi:hypothetical protein
MPRTPALSTIGSLVGIGRAAASAAPVARRYINVEAGLISLTGEDASANLTPSQTADVEAFLQDRPTQLIVEIAAGMVVVNGGLENGRRDMDLLFPTFESLVNKWDSIHSQKWNEFSRSIWAHILDQLNNLLPTHSYAELRFNDEVEEYVQFAQTAIQRPTLKDAFVEQITRLGGRLDDLHQMKALADPIAESAHVSKPGLFSHLTIEHSIDRQKLYIPRALLDEAVNKSISSDVFLKPDVSYRAVILGESRCRQEHLC